MYDYKDAKQVFSKLDQYLEAVSNDVSVNTMMMMTMPPAPFIPEFSHNRSVITLTGLYDGDPKEGEAMVPPAANFYGTSLYFDELSEGLVDEISSVLDNARLPAMNQLWEMHGKMNECTEDANAFTVRDAKYSLLVDVMYESDQKEACMNWTEDLYNRVVQCSHNGASYINGMEPHEEIIEKTYGSNLARLQEIKKKYDPHNVFHMNHNIDPTKKKTTVKE